MKGRIVMPLALTSALTLALALTPLASEAAELSATDKAAINGIARQWQASKPKRAEDTPSNRAQRVQIALQQPGACASVRTFRPLPEGPGVLAVESPVEPGSMRSITPSSIHFIDTGTGQATVVREQTKFQPSTNIERPSDYGCEALTDPSGETIFRVRNSFRLTAAEQDEARRRIRDLQNILAGKMPSAELQQQRCLIPADVHQSTAWADTSHSEFLLSDAIEIPPYRPAFSNIYLQRPLNVRPGYRLRMPGAEWQPGVNSEVRNVATAVLTDWIDHMERVPDTGCTALHAQADKSSRALYAERRRALEGWAAQARLLRDVCPPVKGWYFRPPALVSIQDGYTIEHGDVIHQAQVYFATAVDIGRRQVTTVSVPPNLSEPKSWFSEDPAVQASCQIIVPGRSNTASAYLQRIQSTAAEPELIAVAEELIRHITTGGMRPQQNTPGVPMAPMHRPPDAEIRVNGQSIPLPSSLDGDALYQRFTKLLYESAAYAATKSP